MSSNQSLFSSVASLTTVIGSLTLSDVSSSDLERIMNLKKKEEFIRNELHVEIKQCIRKETKKSGETRSTWFAYSNKQRYQRSTYEDLVELLYDTYSNDKSNITVREAYAEFKENRENDGNISSKTVLDYDSDWRHHIEPNCEWIDKPICGVSIHNISEFFRTVCGSYKMSRKRANNFKSLLSRLWAFAVNKGYCEENIPKKYDMQADGIRFKQSLMVSDSDKAYTEEEAQKMVEYLAALPDKTVYDHAIILNFCLDVRIGELRALTWDDLDFSGEVPCVFIQHQIVARSINGKKRAMMDTGCYTKKSSESGHRVLALSDLALQVIDELHKINGDKKYLFNSETGLLPIAENHYNERLKKHCRDLGIKPKSSHKIRFYNISSLYDSKQFDDKEIQRMSGHSSVQMTEHYNRRIKVENLKAEKDFFNNRFSHVKMAAQHKRNTFSEKAKTREPAI